MGSAALSVRLWAPSGGAGAALGPAVRALSAAPLGVPGKAPRLRWPEGYQTRLPRHVPCETMHPLNIIDFTHVGAAGVLPAVDAAAGSENTQPVSVRTTTLGLMSSIKILAAATTAFSPWYDVRKNSFLDNFFALLMGIGLYKNSRTLQNGFMTHSRSCAKGVRDGGHDDRNWPLLDGHEALDRRGEVDAVNEVASCDGGRE